MQPGDLEAEVRATWDFDNPSASYDAMTAKAGAAPPGSAEHIVWQTQAARALGLQRRFDAANHLLDEARTSAASLADPATTQHALARIAIERGRILNSSGDPVSARPLFTLALNHAQLAGSASLTVDALHMLAIVAESPESSRRLNEQALERAESSPDPEARRWRGSLLNNLGWNFHDAGRFAEALEAFERALDVRREGDEAGGIHAAAWAVARAKRSLGRYDESLATQRSLADTLEGATDGYVYEEIGECLLALGQHSEAVSAFARAHALLSADPWMAVNEADRLTRIAKLAQGS